jgi:t-SNARE complex subunit (syntaxin)
MSASACTPCTQRAIHVAREARDKYWRVLLVTTFFVVVLGGNLFVGAVLVSKALQTATTESPASFHIAA